MRLASLFAGLERLRREYFCQEEGGGPSSAPTGRYDQADQGAFSSDGHRLSSLFRAPKLRQSWLTNGYRRKVTAPSSWQKYSNPTSQPELTLGGAQ